MEIPLKVMLAFIFPITATLIYIFVSRPRNSYFVSAFLFVYALLVLGISQGVILGPVNESFFFPLMFSAGDLYANLLRFSLALTGSVIILYNSRKKDLLFHIVSVWAISSAIILTLAENFLTFYLFWEMVTISAAGIIFLRRNSRAYRNGIIFLLTHLVGGLLLLMGIVKHYKEAGSLLLQEPEAGMIFFLVALGIKTAFVPLHFWLIQGYPSAHWRGTVLLSALSTKVGVYAVARLLEPSLMVAYMGGIMAIFGIIMALLQKKMRPLLSYHIISQVGYMVAGVGLGLSLSVDGGLLHLLNHMLYKALLLMSAGAVIYTCGTEKLSKLGGLLKKAPLISVSALVGSLAISGIPPFNGFISKTMLKYGTEDERLLSIMLLAAGVGTVMSFSKFMFFGFIRQRSSDEEQLEFKPLPGSMKFSMTILSGIVILLGIFPQVLMSLTPYGSSTFVYSFSSAGSSLLTGLVGLIIFFIIRPLIDPSARLLIHRYLDLSTDKVNNFLDSIYFRGREAVLDKSAPGISTSFWIILFVAGLFFAFLLASLVF